MLCERCGKNEVSMEVSIIDNGQKKVIGICKDCAAKMMGNNFGFSLNLPFPMMSNFWGDFGMDFHQNTAKDLQCPCCGMTYRQFTERGRFGCGSCYDAFRERLIPLFKDLHYSPVYCGKLPQCAALVEGEDRLEILVREKESAVAREDYERAAELQKEILKYKGKERQR